jgi:hypothetical protein
MRILLLPPGCAAQLLVEWNLAANEISRAADEMFARQLRMQGYQFPDHGDRGQHPAAIGLCGQWSLFLGRQNRPSGTPTSIHPTETYRSFMDLRTPFASKVSVCLNGQK